ncbi:hypothetical protein [Hydrogenophaga sp. ANAO-22]|uniref:hypothetical protein n=1 Tax=Hydrogenophaga sp. ANAO-22 TaxID=3166645 RepID=UPI0036D3ECDA
MLCRSVLLAALAMPALPTMAADVAGTSAASPTRPDDGPLTGENEGATQEQRFAYLSAVDRATNQPKLVYEICNRGADGLAYKWERFMANSLMHPLQPKTCDVGTLPGPSVWTKDESRIAYGFDKVTTALAYRAGGKGINAADSLPSRIFSGRESAVGVSNMERGLPDAEATVEVVLMNKGKNKRYLVKWKENVGVVALKLAAHSPSARRRLLENLQARQFSSKGRIEVVSSQALLKRFRLKDEDIKRLNEFIGAGDFIVLTTEGKSAGEMSFELSHGAEATSVRYEPVVVVDSNNVVRIAFRYATVTDVR